MRIKLDSFILVTNNSKWIQNGSTVAGGNQRGDQLNQFAHPNAIYVDDDEQAIYIADNANTRIVEWKYGAKNGQVIIGGNGTQNRTDPLESLLDVVFDKNNDSFLICDFRNRQVLRWSRRNNRKGQIIISNISCFTLAIDHNGDIYVYNDMKNEVRRYREGYTNGILVAGGNGIGSHPNQLECPSSMFIDQDLSIYISDGCNDRVVKWVKDARQGILVAGGQGRGKSLSQLYSPKGVTVDYLGNIYVVDGGNQRIMRWLPGAREGSVIVGGNGGGQEPNQLYYPSRLSFDRQGNLYVVDQENNRVQKFDLDAN
jgi:sugar lactone lactonase YvrE